VLQAAGDLADNRQHRPVQYLNNVFEQDHRAIKRRVRASQHFRPLDREILSNRQQTTMSPFRSWSKGGAARACPIFLLKPSQGIFFRSPRTSAPKPVAIHFHYSIHFSNARSLFPPCSWFECSKDRLRNGAASSTGHGPINQDCEYVRGKAPLFLIRARSTKRSDTNAGEFFFLSIRIVTVARIEDE
jgi:hypothetical protein